MLVNANVHVCVVVRGELNCWLWISVSASILLLDLGPEPLNNLDVVALVFLEHLIECLL